MNGRNYNERFVYFINNLLERHNINKLAVLMNVPWQTFRHWIEGHSTFPVTQISPLYNAIKREGVYPEDALHLLGFVLNDTDMMPVPRQGVGATKNVLEEALDVAAGLGKVVQAVQDALSGDGVIDEKEGSEITQAIDNEEKELEELRSCVRKSKPFGNGK